MEEPNSQLDDNSPEPVKTTEGQPAYGEGVTRESDLHDRVSRLESYRLGFTVSFGIIGVIIAVALALLGWLGISGVINDSIEDNVQRSLGEEIQQLLDDLDNRQNQVSDALSRAEIAVGLAEDASGNSRNAASTAQAARDDLFALATEQSAAEGVGEWVVGISSPTTLEVAIQDADRAIRAGYSISIYKIGDFFVPAIGIFPTEDEAKIASLAILSSFARSTALYNLSVSCPYRQFYESGFFGCFLQPMPSPTP